jgi:hypothetical protein
MPEPELIPDTPQNSRWSPIEMGVLALLLVVFLAVSLWRQTLAGIAHNPYDSIGIIVAAGLTLIMYSFLYRDNPLFKIAENLYVGISLGYATVMGWREALRPEVFDPLFRAPTETVLYDTLLHRSVPIILGILLVTRLSRKYGWLSRYSFGTLIGWGSGMGIAITTHTFILKQLETAIGPFQGAGQHPAVATFSWAWMTVVALPILLAGIVMIGTVAVLWYFFFSVEHKRAGGALSKLGILFLMVSFGASFGYTVMGRVSLLIGRVQFLLFEWLKIPR